MNNIITIETANRITKLVNDDLHTAKSIAGKAIHKTNVLSVRVKSGNNRCVMFFDKNPENKPNWVVPKRKKKTKKRK